MGNSAIGRGTAVEEQKVKASSGDSSPGFLDAKVDGVTMNVVADQLVAAGGDLTLVSSTAVSAASESATVAITSQNLYYVRVIITAGSGVHSPWIRFNGDNGATAYEHCCQGLQSNGSETTGFSTGDNYIKPTANNFDVTSTASRAELRFVISTQGTTGTRTLYVQGQAFGSTGSSVKWWDFTGQWNGSAAATGFTITASSGTWTGNIYLYQFATS
jgi:hypothetical protein